jgi:hypothetical protein
MAFLLGAELYPAYDAIGMCQADIYAKTAFCVFPRSGAVFERSG